MSFTDAEQIKLYRRHQHGIGHWRIWSVIQDSETALLYYAHASVVGGSEVRHQDTVTTNKSGRTIEQQVELETKSRVSRQLDKGYKWTYEEASKGSTNQLNLVNPMLALPIEKVSTIRYPAHVQPKYDGHRCLITRQGDEVLAYTRKGKLISTIDHILADFHWLKEGYTVDGELYVHGKPLQSISSLIKRQQPGSADLRYHWYDWVSRKVFRDRLASMRKVRDAIDLKCTIIVPTYEVQNLDEAMEFFRGFRKDGFEGAMLRQSIEGYKPNARANQLLKIKEWHDAEGTVVEINASKEGWAICTLRLDNSILFDISAPGSIPEKTEVLKNRPKYIGRRLTFEYASLTEEGRPFHASALRWRDDLD